MNTQVAATGLDVAFKGVLLFGIEYVAGGGQPNYAAVASQIVFGKHSGIFTSVHSEAFFGAHFLERGLACFDGAVAETGGFAEDQHAWLDLAKQSGGR